MDLTIGVVQMESDPGDVEANLARAERLVAAAAARGANFAVLPEMCTTGGFDSEDLPTLAESIPGPITERLGALAARHRLHLVAGLPEQDGGRYFNSSVLLSPEGQLRGAYRKVHLFSSERRVFGSGDQPAIFDTALGRVALTICYDLVFPEYIRDLVLRGAELIVNSTNWITDDWQRARGWGGPVVRSLAATRALENTVHVAMADRVGTAGTWRSLGHSCVAAPSGALLAGLEEGEGVAVSPVALHDPVWTEWRGIATYLQDRRPALYDRLLGPTESGAPARHPA
jgi:predicted amidohydrolase